MVDAQESAKQRIIVEFDGASLDLAVPLIGAAQFKENEEVSEQPVSLLPTIGNAFLEHTVEDTFKVGTFSALNCHKSGDALLGVDSSLERVRLLDTSADLLANSIRSFLALCHEETERK
jgi:hypothetical protein